VVHQRYGVDLGSPLDKPRFLCVVMFIKKGQSILMEALPSDIIGYLSIVSLLVEPVSNLILLVEDGSVFPPISIRLLVFHNKHTFVQELNWICNTM